LNADSIRERRSSRPNCDRDGCDSGNERCRHETQRKQQRVPIHGPESSSMTSGQVGGSSPPRFVASTSRQLCGGHLTTMSIASTRPKSESVVMEKPNKGKNHKRPHNRNGHRPYGMSVARQPCRKRKTNEDTTQVTPAGSRRFVISLAVGLKRVVSSALHSRISGNRWD